MYLLILVSFCVYATFMSLAVLNKETVTYNDVPVENPLARAFLVAFMLTYKGVVYCALGLVGKVLLAPFVVLP